jgi:UDP-N-acetylglucosamine acyltransferase
MYNLTKHGSKIHQTCIIHQGVEIGSNNTIGPYCIIYADTKIGDDNNFLSHCSIGAPPQHKSYPTSLGTVIGNGNVFREFVTIHGGSLSQTIIGSDNYIMAYCHISHDSILGDGITMANASNIGGHTIIDDFANLGLGSMCHQFSYIGKGSMIGMGTIIPKNKEILPFAIYIGNPANYLKKNFHLLKKYTMSDEQLLKETSLYLENLYKLHNK